MVLDTEDFDGAVHAFTLRFPALFALEAFDSPMLRQLFRKLCDAAALAHREQQRQPEDMWQAAYRRLHDALLKAMDNVMSRGAALGLAPPLAMPDVAVGHVEGPLCRCHRPAAVRTSHTKLNPDRQFYCCYLPYGDPRQCDFFSWKEA